MAKSGKTNTKSKKDNKNTKVVKDNKNQESNPIDGKSEFKRLIKIVLFVTLIFVLFYVVTIVVTDQADKVKKENTHKDIEEAEIQYENIMIGTMLNYDGTYYVFIETKDDIRDNEYNTLIESAKNNEDAEKIYKANLIDSFNKSYLGKEENYYVSDIKDFKVTGSTLVKIVNGKIDSVYDNYDTIKNKLIELA